jgi:hypothetical protein
MTIDVFNAIQRAASSFKTVAMTLKNIDRLSRWNFTHCHNVVYSYDMSA